MSQEFGFEAIRPDLDKQKRDSSPAIRWAAECIEEMYFGGNFAIARMKGPARPDLKYSPKIVRFKALSERTVYGVSVPIFPQSDGEAVQRAQRLRAEVSQLPSIGAQGEILMEFGQQAVSSTGKKVLGALEIAQGEDGSEVVQVCYPKVYIRMVRQVMGMAGLSVNELQARTMASGVAIAFLQSSRFTSERPHILRRENR